MKFIEFVHRQKIIYSVISPSRTIQIRSSSNRSLLSTALKWLNISSGCSSTRKLHKSDAKVVTGMARRRLHNDWFDCSDRASGAIRSEPAESNLIHRGAMLIQRWKLRVPSHIFMSTHGDPFEFVFTTDSLLFFSPLLLLHSPYVCSAHQKCRFDFNLFLSFAIHIFSNTLKHFLVERKDIKEERKKKGKRKSGQKMVNKINECIESIIPLFDQLWTRSQVHKLAKRRKVVQDSKKKYHRKNIPSTIYY